jgi:hypothetical protein
MSKAKTNALDALRALISERQQYEQWIATLEAKREGTPEHVFERVHNDYRGRLERVVGEIRGHAEELQLSISTLSARLVEVARDEDTRREGLQEAELRAAVGEYEPSQWDEIRSEAEAALEKIAADRESLDGQLSELRAIQKLSEMGPGGATEELAQNSAPAVVAEAPVETQAPSVEPAPRTVEREVPPPEPDAGRSTESAGHRSGTAAAMRPPVSETTQAPPPQPSANAPMPSPAAASEMPLEPVASAAAATASAASKPRSMKSPTGGVQAVRARTEGGRPDSAKTLKCPECGTANYPTEWYCERCGGELATM